MTYPRLLAANLADALRGSREDLVARWLERINARVTLKREDIFPTDDLLNHVPLLIDGVADYLENPESDLNENAPVVAKAMELGALRHSQGFDAYQILKEHEILGAILCAFVLESVDSGRITGTPRDLLLSWQRISHALELMRQATTMQFLRLSGDRIKDRESRLRRFNRMVSHELKNRVGAISGAGHLLQEPWLKENERADFQQIIVENARSLQQLMGNLEALSRIESDSRQRRNVLLPQATAEAVRQLRTQSQAKGIDVRIADDLPPIEVDAAATELCLVNYISNAIKYSDPSKSDRWVEISANFDFGGGPSGSGELVVLVRDNGIGVPVGSRAELFRQFYRAHEETVTDVDGSGLGLNIVRETVESLGGRAWAEFPETGGAVFAFSLPSRREEDAAAAGTRRLGEAPE
ncbi:MAG TPA: sensor histidine kinase [Gemmatimonadaceae bacterium]|nr:sensor histidine kinase [Gemmatimonadaceae bacterium]